MANKFKSIEKTKSDDIIWEGEEVTAHSDTKIESDLGIGQAIVIRFFEFAANQDTFKLHKPTAQELFNSHKNGIMAMLWKDGLKPFNEVEPKLMFSKSKKNYRFILTCVPNETLVEKPQTLSQLLTSNPIT